MKTCLIVIDTQESFRQRPYFVADDLPAYATAQNALIAGCVQRGVPVVQVLHVGGPAVPGNPFARESGHVKPLAEIIPFEPAATFYKTRHSALVGTGLEVWLTENGIGKLIVSGIRTEQCCETTTRHASDLGWTVDYVPEATLTWAMRQTDGRTLSVADLRLRTATVLHERFARVCSVQDALASA